MAKKVEISDAQMDMAAAAIMSGHCDMDHTNDPAGPNPRATNTLMIPLKQGGGMLSLHVCAECEESLREDPFEWHLFVCFKCGSAKWMHKDYVRRPYNEQIIGMNECPNCYSV